MLGTLAVSCPNLLQAGTSQGAQTLLKSWWGIRHFLCPWASEAECPCSLVPKQQLPKLLLLPRPSAHRGLGELLSLTFCSSALWRTGTCSALVLGGGFLLSGLALLQAARHVPATGSSAAGVPAGSPGCSASHLCCRGVQLSSANRNDLKYRFPVLS